MCLLTPVTGLCVGVGWEGSGHGLGCLAGVARCLAATRLAGRGAGTCTCGREVNGQGGGWDVDEGNEWHGWRQRLSACLVVPALRRLQSGRVPRFTCVWCAGGGGEWGLACLLRDNYYMRIVAGLRDS
eukprot:2126684-Prymnesium_polylepis.1